MEKINEITDSIVWGKKEFLEIPSPQSLSINVTDKDYIVVNQ